MKFCLCVVFFAVWITACRKEPLFVADPSDGRLPEYSQQGRNIAGALINDKPWRSQRLEFYASSYNPLVIHSDISGDSTYFEFYGLYPIDNHQETNFRAVLKGFRLLDIDSLMRLSGKAIEMDGIERYWTVSENFDEYFLKGTGTISFLHVEPNVGVTYVNDGLSRHPYIVSGLFDIQFPGPLNYSVTKGRFDMTIRPRYEFTVK